MIRKRKVILEPTPLRIPKELSLQPKFFWWTKLPDLTIIAYSDEFDVSAVPAKYKVKTTIKNIGLARSNPSRVYVNAISLVSNPELNEIRLQCPCNLPELNPNDTFDCVVSFDLAKMHAREVGRIEVLVDPKEEVFESREDNNTESWNWPS